MSLYDIEKIKIMIKTNIPDKEPISFDSKMLYIQNKTGYSDYPYITKQVRYPYSKLAKMEYSDIAYFFFNKNAFIQQLSSEIKKITPSEKPEEKKKREDDNIEYNIITMLELLFPTYYPTYNNFYISFVSNMGGQIEIPQKSVFGSRNKRFSYINIDKPYTISKITWLNDVINHPVYGDFIDDFYNYKKWIERTVPEIDNKIKTIQNDINLLIQKNDANNEIKLLQKYLNEINIQSRYSDNSQRIFMINNMIQILNIIGIYKKYIIGKKSDPNKAVDDFRDQYKKILNEKNFLKNSWVEYKVPPPSPVPATTYVEWWYPVKINNDNGDDTYDIDVFKDEVVSTYEFSKELVKNIPKENLRQLSFLQISDITENYQYVRTFRNRKKSYELFELSPGSSEQLFEKIQVNSVNNKTGKAEITYTDGTTDVELFFLRSKVKTSDIIIDTKTPEEYLADSLYKLKESYEKNGYTNFSLDFKNYIKKLLEFSGYLIKINTIKQNYLNTDKDYLKFDSTFKVDEEFEQFTEMSKSVQKISSSSTKTTNNILQLLIDDYVNNSKKYEVELERDSKKYKTHLFYELLNYIINCYWLNGDCNYETIKNAYDKVDAPNKDNIKNFENFIEDKTLFKTLFKTNINRINLKGGKNLPHYEIYIAADLLGDKIDETNVNKIKCAYNDYNATKNLKGINNIHNPYIIEQGPLIELPKNPQNDLDKKPPIKIGGRTKRKRNKNKKRPRKITQRNKSN